nr:hypothetical protein BaRGS_014329 [Batillaria attramentaria]
MPVCWYRTEPPPPLPVPEPFLALGWGEEEVEGRGERVNAAQRILSFSPIPRDVLGAGAGDSSMPLIGSGVSYSSDK